jgi:hypothetical protein
MALWTGKEALLFGAGGSSGGLKFDPEGRRWMKISQIPGVFSALNGATAVWTGKEALIWGRLRLQRTQPARIRLRSHTRRLARIHHRRGSSPAKGTQRRVDWIPDDRLGRQR